MSAELVSGLITWFLTWVISIIICVIVAQKIKDQTLKFSIGIGFVLAFFLPALTSHYNLSFVGLLGVYMFFYPILILPFSVCVKAVFLLLKQVIFLIRQSKRGQSPQE